MVLNSPVRSPTLIISASIPLFSTFTRCPKQASTSAAELESAVTAFSAGLLTGAPFSRGCICTLIRA